VKVRFAITGGNPSDGSGAITSPWKLGGPSSIDVPAGGDATVTFNVEVPRTAAPGSYTGELLASVSNGQSLHLPIFASVALHDANTAANALGAQARVDTPLDVFAKGDTLWPAIGGQAISGALSDWRVYPVELASKLKSATFTVWDSSTAGDDTYDLYLYDSNLALETSTHLWLGNRPGYTDVNANKARPASTAVDPLHLVVSAPTAGRHYLVVSRARVGALTPGTGDFGSYSLRLDEAR
jgi:hypothetical protein